jgi:hypothetical protein
MVLRLLIGRKLLPVTYFLGLASYRNEKRFYYIIETIIANYLCES